MAFDRDDQLFATVGVSRRVKLFDFRACLESDPGMVHYPVLQVRWCVRGCWKGGLGTFVVAPPLWGFH